MLVLLFSLLIEPWPRKVTNLHSAYPAFKDTSSSISLYRLLPPVLYDRKRSNCRAVTHW